jgi:hypothetical protein
MYVLGREEVCMKKKEKEEKIEAADLRSPSPPLP